MLTVAETAAHTKLSERSIYTLATSKLAAAVNKIVQSVKKSQPKPEAKAA